MKIKANTENLMKTLAMVERAVPGKTTIPALKNILVTVDENKVEFVANNLDFSIKGTVEEAEITQQGKALAPPKLVEIIKNLTGEVVLEAADDNQLKISSGKSNFTLSCEPVENFPLEEDNGEWETVILKAGELRAALPKVLFAISQDEGRPVFKGVLMGVKEGKFFAIATDTYRMAEYKADTDCESDFRIIVPGASLKDMLKAIPSDDEEEVKFFFSEKELLVFVGKFTFRMRLIDGKFPNVDGVWPKESLSTVTADAEPLQQAINRASLLAHGANRMVVLQIEENNVIVSSSSETGDVKEELETETSGEELQKIMLNAGFVQDGIKASINGKSKIAINFNGPTGAVVMNNNDYRYLLLPIKTG